MDTTLDAFDPLDAFDAKVYRTAPDTDVANVTLVVMPTAAELYRPAGSEAFRPSARHEGKFPESEVNPKVVTVEVALFTVPDGDAFPSAGTGGKLSLFPNLTEAGTAGGSSGSGSNTKGWAVRAGDPALHLRATDYVQRAFDRGQCRASKDLAKGGQATFNEHCAQFMPPTFKTEFAVRQPINGRFEVPQGSKVSLLC